MDKNDYKKLNDYLNTSFIFLEKNDDFLLYSLYDIGYLSDLYVDMINKCELNNEVDSSDYLSYEDVFLLAREIIENINPNYLQYYDALIKNGTLDLSYNNDYNDSHYYADFVKKISLININRTFNYDEVCTLVHEFMHMMNGLEKPTKVRHVLTEFISIYFEEYARTYLLDKGIDRKKLDFNGRFMSIKRNAEYFRRYSMILLIYENFGYIDQDSYLALKEYFGVNVSKEEFEEICYKNLLKMEKVEKEYRMEIMFEEDFDDDKFGKKLCNYLGFDIDYRYIIGTLLACYQLKNDKKDKMVYLNDHINDYSNKSFNKVLSSIDISLGDIKPEELISIVEEYIQGNNKKR